MANRTRPIVKRFCVTPEESEIIAQKMRLAKITNSGEYLRQIAMKGYIVEVDFSAVKELAKEVGGISRNINQITKRVNTTDTLYKEDLAEIQEYMEKVWRMVRRTLLKKY